MAYDPTLPVNGSPIVAVELRNQFNGLNASLSALSVLVGNLPTSADVQDAINTSTPAPLGGFPTLNLTVSDPPAQADVQAIADKLDDLINALKR